MSRHLRPMLAVAGTLAIVPIIATAASAGGLPVVRTGADNPLPECATAGRLMAYLTARNPALDQRYAGIAAHYVRLGQELGIRSDYAFFQMIVETGNLSFRSGGGRPGTVKAAQNNFAGLGAVGGGVPGESFPDIATGVKAHLQHLLMYTGERIASPVAERTRKVQEWEVLTPWHKSINHPVSFADVTRKWAVDPTYGASVEAVGRRFYDNYCGTGEPVAREAAAPAAAATVDAPARVTAPVRVVAQAQPQAERAADGERVSGVELARRAIERARAEGDGARSGLGFAPVPDDLVASPAPRSEPLPPEFTASEPEAASPAPPVPRAAESRPVASQSAIMPDQSAGASVIQKPAAPAAEKSKPAAVTALVHPALPAKPVSPIDDAVRAMVSGRTFILDATMGMTIPIVFRDNGSMRGSAGGLASYLGAPSDEGRWWVLRGRLCQRWNVWLSRETQCLHLRQAGQTIHWVRDDGKTGTARLSAR